MIVIVTQKISDSPKDSQSKKYLRNILNFRIPFHSSLVCYGHNSAEKFDSSYLLALIGTAIDFVKMRPNYVYI